MSGPDQPAGGGPGAAAASESIARLNIEIADRVRSLDPVDMVEVLSGRASSLLRADSNQNQNQNGSRVPRAPEE